MKKKIFGGLLAAFMLASASATTISTGGGTLSGVLVPDGYAGYTHVVRIQGQQVLDTATDEPGTGFRINLLPGDLDLEVFVRNTGKTYTDESENVLWYLYPRGPFEWMAELFLEDLDIDVSRSRSRKPEFSEPDFNDLRLFFSYSANPLQTSNVPEPTTVGLMGLGLVAVGIARRRRS